MRRSETKTATRWAEADFAPHFLLLVAATIQWAVGSTGVAEAALILDQAYQRVSSVRDYAVKGAYSLFVLGLFVCFLHAIRRSSGSWWIYFFSCCGGCFLVFLADKLFAFLATGT